MHGLAFRLKREKAEKSRVPPILMGKEGLSSRHPSAGANERYSSASVIFRKTLYLTGLRSSCSELCRTSLISAVFPMPLMPYTSVTAFCSTILESCVISFSRPNTPRDCARVSCGVDGFSCSTSPARFPTLRSISGESFSGSGKGSATALSGQAPVC